MNLPNKLTVSRLVFTALFLAVLSSGMPYHETVALGLFGIASFTDYLDGWIARRCNLITNFGILMDPLADKILTCGAFIALVGRGRVEAWMVTIIVSRELAITGLRLLAASKQLVLAAEAFGKHKTISQVVAIIAILVVEAYREWGDWAQVCLATWVPSFARVALVVTVTLTFTSGLLYLWRNRAVYLHDA